MNKSGARGRRRGRPDTRTQLLAIARRRFLAEGYRTVTMRSLAAEAGIDAALISYFFGSKHGLFAAALDLAANPPDVLRAALSGDLATLPERLLHHLMTTWDDPARADQFRVVIAAAARDPQMAKLLSEMLEREVIDLLTERLRGDDARQRAGAVSSQLGGLIFARYILGLEPIASMATDELIRYLAPPLRTALRPHPPLADFRRVPRPGT